MWQLATKLSRLNTDYIRTHTDKCVGPTLISFPCLPLLWRVKWNDLKMHDYSAVDTIHVS